MVKAFEDINSIDLTTLIIGVDPMHFAPHLPMDLRFSVTRPLFKYLHSSDKEGKSDLLLEEEAEKLTEFKSGLSRRIEMRYGALDVDAVFDPETGDIIRLYGHQTQHMGPLNYVFDPAKVTQLLVTAKACNTLHPRRLFYFEELLKLVAKKDVRVEVFTNPLHPDLAEFLQSGSPYYDVQTQLVDWIESISGPNVNVHRVRTPADFGGLDSDYFDGSHMGRHNGDALLDYIFA